MSLKHKHDPQTFRGFFLRWIGIHLLCTLIFFVFHSLCFGLGLLVSDDPITPNALKWNEEIWDLCATLAPVFAVFPTLAILSLLQSIVSRRTIDVMPTRWFRITSLAYLPIYIILFAITFYETDANARQGLRSSLTTLFVPLYIMFAWMALVQGLCFLRDGIREIVIWTAGCVLPLLILIPFNERVYIDTGAFIFNFYPLLIAYPILLMLVTAGLCYRRWKQADLRKRHAD